MKMNLDFIEIGTADFGTLLDSHDSNDRSISIEPIQEYLNKLPDKKNNIKICAAIVDEEFLEEVDIYYVNEENIKKYNLGWWLKGCNSIKKPHDLHLNYCENPMQFHKKIRSGEELFITRDLVKEGLVEKRKVPCLTFKKLAEKYNLNYVRYIKIDAEGMDVKILNSILDYYEKNKKIYPQRIEFESNSHIKIEEIKQASNRLKKINYKVEINYLGETIAIKENKKIIDSFKLEKKKSNISGLLWIPSVPKRNNQEIFIEFFDHKIVKPEFTLIDQALLKNKFNERKENCKCILEIGVNSLNGKNSSKIFFENKFFQTYYFGIGIPSKDSYLKHIDEKKYIISKDPKNIEGIIEEIRKFGIKEIDFLLIDRNYSINGVLNDWNFSKYLSPGGIIAIHNTNFHPGPYFVFDAIDPNQFIKEKHFEHRPDDGGLSFAIKK